MQLLDVTLAFALTMAALATVVTVIMEAFLRLTRMRKKNLIEEMKLLNKELGNSPLGMTDEERWKFFVRVVENPVGASIEKLKPEWETLSLDDRLAYFGRDKAAGKGKLQRAVNFCLQIFGDKKRRGLYEKVSLEYMIRCLADVESIKQASATKADRLKVEFNRIARRYEEIGSSVSTSFKYHAQAWSIAAGVGLALVANIDGVRIFEAYWQNPELTAAVIVQNEELLKRHQKVQESYDQMIAADEAVREAENELQKAREEDPQNIKEMEQNLESAKAAFDEYTPSEILKETVEVSQDQINNLISLGIPLGWKMYPNCPFGGEEKEWANSGPKCKAIQPDKEKGEGEQTKGGLLATAMNDPAGFFLWFLIVVMTGTLMGLGAPFWFDVAKRLAQIRKGLQNENASAEYRLSAKDANGDIKVRKEIVETVLEDAAAEAKKSASSGKILGPTTKETTYCPKGMIL